MLKSFLDQLKSPLTGEELFDHLSDIVYFIKNERCEYLLVNRTLADRCGVRDKQRLIGRKASEVLQAPLGESFEEQDRSVLSTGQPITSRLELHSYASAEVGWCLTTKLPLRAKSGKVIGVIGVSQDLRLPDSSSHDYRSIADALTHAEQNVHDAPSVAQLAKRAGMSHYQFDRRMQTVFGFSARQWLVKLRIGLAERLLRDTDEPITEIAYAAGYTDQSAFTRQFSRTTGMTPRRFRQSLAPE